MSDLTAVATDEPDAIRVEFTLGPEDLDEVLARSVLRAQRQPNWALVLTAVITVVALVTEGLTDQVRWLLLSFVLQLVAMWQIRAVRRRIPTVTFESRQVWTFKSDEVLHESAGMTIRYDWSHYCFLTETPNLFLLTPVERIGLVLHVPLPKRAFDEAGVRKRFVALCREKGLAVEVGEAG